MARLCVRARRLDAAELCLGKMGHARGLRAVREARADDAGNNALVALATAAIQLGMLDEAARLHTEARRPDLLLRFLVARGQWAEALRLVEEEGMDPLRRRRVHFEYAVHLEALGMREEATRHYEMVRAQSWASFGGKLHEYTSTESITLHLFPVPRPTTTGRRPAPRGPPHAPQISPRRPSRPRTLRCQRGRSLLPRPPSLVGRAL